jgi:hypothetical protein
MIIAADTHTAIKRRPHGAIGTGDNEWYTPAEYLERAEVDGPGPHLIGGEKVMARSRTFIPGRLADNPDLADGQYAAVLAGLPETLRKAYRDGDFSAGIKDDAYQVIPTAWIEEAQKRWKPKPPREQMTALGVDVAQGGEDWTVVAPRYGGWYDRLTRKPGRECRDGTAVAAMIITVRRNACPVVVDCGGGWGTEAYGALKEQGIPAEAYKGIAPSNATTREGNLRFANKRAEDRWRFREELNPDQEFGSAIALPPGAQIKADLAAPRWELTSRGIKVEDKAEIRKRLGRSPDDGDAIVLALNEGGKAAAKQVRDRRRGDRSDRANVGHSEIKRRLYGEHRR